MNEDQEPSVDAKPMCLPATPWGPWSGLSGGIAVAAASLLAVVIGVFAQGFIAGETGRGAGWAPMLLLQITMAGGAVWLAGWFGGRRRQVLAFNGPIPSANAFVVMLLVLLAFTVPYTFAIYMVRPDVLVADNRQFVGLMRSGEWLVYALIIGVGAPLSEELLFRGFMLPALAKGRIGFTGAALVTTVLWTALHFSYSVFGLIEIFMIGLILSWALWRTGSLWAPLALHAINNGALAFAMKFQLLPWT